MQNPQIAIHTSAKRTPWNRGKLTGAKHNAAAAPATQSGAKTGTLSTTHFLIVTHAGVIRAAMSAFSGLPLRRAFELRVPYGSCTTFCRHGSRWTRMDLMAGGRNLSRGSAR